MRRLLLLTLPLLAASAHAASSIVQASVTLALTLTKTGAETTAPGKNATTLHQAPLDKVRLGNRELLENLADDDVLPTETITGWSVVALWANWTDENPYAGNSYRFFARRGKGENLQLVPIPASYLSLKPLRPAVGYRTTVSGETVLSGTETFTVYEECLFRIEGHIGNTTGLLTGDGRYVRRSDLTYFVPSASKTTFLGTYEDEAPAATGVVGGSLTFGAAKLVTTPDVGTSYDSVSGVVKTGSGTLTLGGTGSFSGTTTVRGGTLSPGGSLNITLQPPSSFGSVDGAVTTDLGTLTLGSTGTITVSGTTLIGGTFSRVGNINLTVQPSIASGTLILSQAATLTFSPLPASTDTLTTILSFSSAGTLTLGTGETLALTANDTLALNTLSLAQLSPLVWTLAPIAP